MNERGNWIQTFTGGRFYPSDPRYEDIHIEDIAHGLSLTCRFGGQCDHFYSVAEHSWRVAMLCPQKDRLAGLMHDAPEAYLGDIPRPIKRTPGFEEQYRALEARTWRVVAGKYGLPLELPQSVHDADTAMLFAERDQLWAKPRDEFWAMGLETPIKQRPVIIGWGPKFAKLQFLSLFEELTCNRTTKLAA